MTEEEAKTKWCPQTLASIWNDARKAYTETHGSRCIGSACMAWRWLDDPEAMEDEPYEGFCGLAGVPHA